MTTPLPPQLKVPDLRAALAERRFPTVTAWNRLEGRPRRADFSRALKAEVRDALWMLTKQWQLGEFQADDAGSPIFAKVAVRTSPVGKYQAAGAPVEPYDPSVPMEAKAEQRAIAWTWNGQKMRFDLRAQAGRHWRKLLGAAGLAGYLSQYVTAYPIALPAQDTAGDHVYAHRRGWQQLAALAGRTVDGGDLLAYLAGAGHHASDGITLAVPTDGPKLDALGDELGRWFAAQYLQPAADAAWKPEYLEYQFSCSAPQAGTETVLAAEGYAEGHLDWYAFNRAGPPGGLGAVPGTPPAEAVTVSPFIPTPVTFQGMPDPRWWALEDRKTDFGAVSPSTTDLAQLLLMEFGLVYANDWFLVPVRLPAGALARVEGLAVTNVFGERFWVLPAGTGPQDDWHRWAMFQLASTDPATSPADSSLFVPPATAGTADGDPLEEVELARDEVADLVWAIERAVPSVAGPGRPGKDEARETLQYQQRLVAANPAPPVAFAAPIAYQAMSTVPEHWIPFIPTHVAGSNREIQLQRSRLLRIIERDPNPPVKVPPRTTLIRQGLDLQPQVSYFVHEEEVPRAGTTVSERFRRVRWTGGQAYVWLGVLKETGRGERLSGLAFDSIVGAK